ncbi:hypothetical protein DFO55_12487 [Grimontella sp. AG753]|nr:hypothetical protein DFO55_12487 [Grimontella sp. AG753]
MNEETLKVIARFPHLKPGVSVAPDVISHGYARVEIRKDGCLCWRMFEFEANFIHELERNLEYVSL